MKAPKICVISVYFGKLPNYLPLWLKSCQENQTIDFLLVTDQVPTVALPSNVHLLPYTLDKMRQRITEMVGFEVALARPYKCCDYRPLYGLLFAEQLQGYDYWGHCDMDMMFGDIRAFADKYQLEKYDKFLPLGHLSLYRNTAEVNGRYQLDGAHYADKAIDYKIVFSNEKSFIFDEIPGMFSIYKKHHFPVFTKRIFVDIASIFVRYRMIDVYEGDPTTVINYKQQIFYWENGKIWRAYLKNGKIFNEEYIYIHFKKRPNFTVNFPVDSVSGFYITATGFYPKTSAVTLTDIQNFNPYCFLKETGESMRRVTLTLLRSVKKCLNPLLRR